LKQSRIIFVGLFGRWGNNSELFLAEVGAHTGVFRTICAEAKDAEKLTFLSVLEPTAMRLSFFNLDGYRNTTSGMAQIQIQFFNILSRKTGSVRGLITLKLLLCLHC
jgi:hypothetical protein